MWRLGTPMQISHDINPHDEHRGIPPIGSPVEFLVDNVLDYLMDGDGKYLVEDLTP